MYVTCVVKSKGTRLAKPVLSLGFMCLAFLTGLNRVAEYRNHWSDVIAGYIIGTAIATFLVVCVVHNFKGKLLLTDNHTQEHVPSSAMLNLGQVESPLEKYSSQEMDSENEQYWDIKEKVVTFMRWLRGLDWFSCFRNKRTTSPSQRSHDLESAVWQTHWTSTLFTIQSNYRD